MEGQFANTIFYGTVAGIATLIGVYMIFAREEWARKNSVFFLSFSAGVVLAVTFSHVMPEAVENTHDAYTIMLATIIIFYILEHTILIRTCRDANECELAHMGLTSFVGIAVHSLVDGVVIGVGFEAGFTIGFATAIAILLHRLPVGIAISSLLLHSGYSKKKTLIMGWVIALTAIVGAVGAYFFLQGSETETIGILLAFSAGTFIYIGASDLLPETHKNYNKANIALVLVGVLLVYIISSLTGGGHAHTHAH
ncbi:MAG: ZIP family metal transporter [Deltaproteobacteria bacterium]|nr:ZIP family metal transporter [Deltaproteobacteria bacterium]